MAETVKVYWSERHTSLNAEAGDAWCWWYVPETKEQGATYQFPAATFTTQMMVALIQKRGEIEAMLEEFEAVEVEVVDYESSIETTLSVAGTCCDICGGSLQGRWHKEVKRPQKLIQRVCQSCDGKPLVTLTGIPKPQPKPHKAADSWEVVK